MSNRFNVSNMKINHRSRESRMSEPLLYMHYVLSVLQEMSGCTVPQVVDGDGMVECDPCEGVLENDTHIAWSDALWPCLAAMTLEDIVVARILLAVCLEHHEHLVGDGNVAVFAPLALEDEQLPAVKADVVPSETARLTDPEGAVVDDGKQGLVIQGTAAEKTGDLLLGEHSWQSLWLAHFWKHEAVWLLKPHHLVVGLQSEHCVLEEREAATVLGKERRQIVVDVCLGELLRQLIEKQHCLSNLQAIIINTVVCILCDAQFFSKQFDTFPKIGNGFYSLVQCVIGHGFFVVEGINDGVVNGICPVIFLHLLKKRKR